MNYLEWKYHEPLYMSIDIILRKLSDLMKEKGTIFFEKIEKSKSANDFQLIFTNMTLKFNSEKEKLIMYITFIKNIDQLFSQKMITIDFLKLI